MARAPCLVCILLLGALLVTVVNSLPKHNKARPSGRQLTRLAVPGRSRHVGHGFRRPSLNRNWDSQDTDSFSDYDQDQVEQGTFQQKLDHFNANESTDDAWTQYYYVNKRFYRKGGPMFVLIGSESAASESDISSGSGSYYNNAQAFNAMLFTLEHRYFGQSLPTKNYCTRDSMRWLTTQQALADLANWIPAMKEKYDLVGAPVICFGGSYPGNLAAWFRLKYPDIATGCVASSAPLLAKEDDNGYDQIVAKAMDYWSAGCSDKLAQGFAKLQKVLKSADRANQLSVLMGCGMYTDDKLLDSTDGVAQLAFQLVYPWQDAAQYNLQGPNNLTAMCERLKNAADPLTAMFQISQDSGCMQSDIFSEEVLEQANQECNDNRGWLYLVCNELGYQETSDAEQKVFSPYINLQYDIKMKCTESFGIKESEVRRAVNRTNSYYGGLDIDSTNLILVYGSLDPCAADGKLTYGPKGPSTDPHALRILMMDGASHCYDMQNYEPPELPNVKSVRQTITNTIGIWLGMTPRSITTTTTTVDPYGPGGAYDEFEVTTPYPGMDNDDRTTTYPGLDYGDDRSTKSTPYYGAGADYDQAPKTRSTPRWSDDDFAQSAGTTGRSTPEPQALTGGTACASAWLRVNLVGLAVIGLIIATLG